MSDSVRTSDAGAAVARDEIRGAVTSWAGVSALPGPLPGSIELRFRHRVLGHLHSVWGTMAMADLVFPPAIGEALIAAGRADPHPMFPALGWVTVPVRCKDDAARVIALFRENYDRIAGQLRLV